jgi:uncharacterized protein (TIGR00299 family) protein
MKTLYLDLFSGISGDMFIGALLDLGVDFRALETELLKLRLDGCHLHARRALKSGISGVKFDVHIGHHEPHTHAAGETPPSHEHEHGHGHTHAHTHEHGHSQSHVHQPETHAHESHTHEDAHSHTHSHGEGHEHAHSHGREHSHDHSHTRDFNTIRQLIESSSLSPWVREKAVAVFDRVARAEGRIHGVPPDQVHFHEVGALDSIMDIVGACVCLELLGRPRVLAGRVFEGTGTIHCAHGNFPIPAPATLAILAQRGIPLTQCDEPHELVTPTGAALLAEFVENFGPMRDLAPGKIGFGLGTRDNLTRPNVLRAILAENSTASGPGWEADTVAVLETNLDDTTPELLGAFLETAMERGALDVFFAPIQMKKNRPAALLSLICAPSEADRFSELILRETSAFGVRRAVLERRKVSREFKQAPTPFGQVTIKLGRIGDEIVHAAPEYESCRRLAAAAGQPVGRVFEAARVAAHDLLLTSEESHT